MINLKNFKVILHSLHQEETRDKDRLSLAKEPFLAIKKAYIKVSYNQKMAPHYI